MYEDRPVADVRRAAVRSATSPEIHCQGCLRRGQSPGLGFCGLRWKGDLSSGIAVFQGMLGVSELRLLYENMLPVSGELQVGYTSYARSLA